MSKSNLWTSGTLFSRGWTDALMRELLPKPQWRQFNGRRMRCWYKEDVLAAEETDRFQAEAKAERLRRSETQVQHSADTESVLTAAAELLTAAFGAPGEDAPALLSGRYHEGILSLLPSLPHPERLRPGQAESYIGSFLSGYPPRRGEYQQHPAPSRRRCLVYRAERREQRRHQAEDQLPQHPAGHQ